MPSDRTSACSGGEHTLLFQDGKLFSAGACGLGWCRQHPLTAALFAWRQVPGSEPYRLMYASYYHNLAVGSLSGKLYSWGCGTFTDGGMDGVIPALGQGAAATDLGDAPKTVDLPDKNDDIIQLSGGAYHSIVLMKSGTIYTFGAGQLGQLGRPTEGEDASGLPVDPSPRKTVGVPSDEQVIRIGSGFYNTLAMCQSGSLYCSGENQNQQCGQGPKNLHEMTRVIEVDNVEQAEGGYCHTLLKSLEGKVFSMGCWEEGQRGIRAPKNDDEDLGESLDTAAEINLPEGVRAHRVAAGANHSVILGTNGVAYTFGANDVGQCGVESDRLDEDDDDDEGGPVWTPKPVSLPAHVGHVVEVSAGYAHTALTTSTGKVFTFGQNDNGQLGQGVDIVNPNGSVDAFPSLRPKEVIATDARKI